MLSLPERAAVERALAGPLPKRLHDLLAASHASAVASGVGDLTHYLVVQSGDAEIDIMREVGFSPLTNPIDGARFGTAAFQPWWDWLSHEDGWFLLISAIGMSGFAYVLLIEDDADLDHDLLDICQRHASRR